MRFSSDLDANTLDQLAVGRSLMRVLRQPPTQPVPVHKQVVVLYAGTQKALVKIPEAHLREAINALYEATDNSETGQAYSARFKAKPALDDDLKQMLNTLIEGVVKKYRKD